MSSLRLLINHSIAPLTQVLAARTAVLASAQRGLRTVKSSDRAAASHTRTELIEDGLRYDPKDLKDFFDKVNTEISEKLPRKRMFAVIYLYNQQFLCKEGDIIQVRKYFPAEMGARVKIEKVLLVGSDNLTLLGRPVLDRDLVHVEATVVEKCMSQTYTNCYHVQRRSGYRRWRMFRAQLSALRINKISVCHNINESPNQVQ